MAATEAVLVLHALSTVAMAGLIWFVQVVHYPLMARVGAGSFRGYEAEHVRRTTWVVAPLMLTEAASATWLAWRAPSADLRWAALVGFGLLAVVWSSTALLQVPCHRKLEGGFDTRIARRLVATNWLRTLPWTARAGLAIHLLIAGR